MNPVRLASTAAVMGIPLVAAYGLVAGVPALLVVGALHSAFWAFVTLPGQAAVAKVAPAGQAGEAQGLVEAYGLTLAAGGAFAAAPIYEAAGPTVLFFITGRCLGDHAHGGLHAAEQVAAGLLRNRKGDAAGAPYTRVTGLVTDTATISSHSTRALSVSVSGR